MISTQVTANMSKFTFVGLSLIGKSWTWRVPFCLFNVKWSAYKPGKATSIFVVSFEYVSMEVWEILKRELPLQTWLSVNKILRTVQFLLLRNGLITKINRNWRNLCVWTGNFVQNYLLYYLFVENWISNICLFFTCRLANKLFSKVVYHISPTW